MLIFFSFSSFLVKCSCLLFYSYFAHFILLMLTHAYYSRLLPLMHGSVESAARLAYTFLLLLTIFHAMPCRCFSFFSRCSLVYFHAPFHAYAFSHAVCCYALFAAAAVFHIFLSPPLLIISPHTRLPPFSFYMPRFVFVLFSTRLFLAFLRSSRLSSCQIHYHFFFISDDDFISRYNIY